MQQSLANARSSPTLKKENFRAKVKLLAWLQRQPNQSRDDHGQIHHARKHGQTGNSARMNCDRDDIADSGT